MKTSLRVKLSAAFFALSLLLLLVIGVLANVVLERQFRQYVIGNLDKNINDTVQMISGRYQPADGSWDVVSIETIGMNALGNGLIVRLEAPDGKVIWDAQTHNGGMCASLLAHMAGNMKRYSGNFTGGDTEKQYPLSVDGKTIGSAAVGYYGPYFFTDADLRFVATLNNLLLWAAGISALVSLLVGLWLAGRLTRPIAGVVQAAGLIAKGEYRHRLQDRSGTKEITALTNAVNSLADALQEQEALRKRLTADVAHELRTPLATLQSHLEAMIDGVWASDTARLTSCHEETLRLSRLVGDLEALARVEQEHLPLAVAPVDLRMLLQRIAANFEGPFRSKGVALNLNAAPLTAEADEDKLSQVVVNLLANALQYTPKGGQVTLELSQADDHIVLRVTDTGIGISAEDLPHVFERFYRADRSRSRQTGGSGIGLSIVKAIVEAHGGDVSAQSTPGVGTAFTVIIPIRQLSTDEHGVSADCVQ